MAACLVITTLWVPEAHCSSCNDTQTGVWRAGARAIWKPCSGMVEKQCKCWGTMQALLGF